MIGPTNPGDRLWVHQRVFRASSKLLSERPMAKVMVLGAGMMGSALCVPLVDAGHDVRLVGTHLDDTIIQELRTTGIHPKLRCELPRALQSYQATELADVMRGVDVVGLGVSSAGVRWAAEQLKPFMRAELPIIMITKGLVFDGRELRVLPDVLRDELFGPNHGGMEPTAVAGPCIAGELVRRVETASVLTGRSRPALERLRGLLQTDYYHPRVSSDVVGVEVCAALKNAYALGVALAWGLHEKRGGSPGSIAMHNTEAALFAQALIEMRRVVEHCGGDPDSVARLPGAGDLFVTCNAGRTGRFGRLLGMGLGRDEAIARMQGATLESLEILQVMRAAMAETRGRLTPGELPLLAHLAEVALDDMSVRLPFDRFF
jgi:glycerol-3-phosphate dehydrogenase (NAD(P)+)